MSIRGRCAHLTNTLSGRVTRTGGNRRADGRCAALNSVAATNSQSASFPSLSVSPVNKTLLHEHVFLMCSLQSFGHYCKLVGHIHDQADHSACLVGQQYIDANLHDLHACMSVKLCGGQRPCGQCAPWLSCQLSEQTGPRDVKVSGFAATSTRSVTPQATTLDRLMDKAAD
jgi:hypothetical protein